MNVLKNGSESIDNGGTIHVAAWRSSDTIVINMKDSGRGMTQEQLDQLGQPFYSLKEKGTGLGLMVTFRIVESHGGKIFYRS
ncbi:ATP-binding protein, partial [Salmonella enterica]|uniref:ATP-binding protein n=1 Tax=Salmonella enterica TaxID=28901 RepID=UPI0022B60DA5